ncbi:type VI secretion system baseplate subunit TssE [Vibrio coralliilyticus]|uniref:type VI secretion system baseplate subunit TssE n=1 Tax=Vibrio coralliilyticus TaxID=190893 RepID=UPI0006CD8D3A|nr:type VI secretion system baseplate subunit TssE [Vibrio coralliilyticus]AXN30347.1 type VI secretion system baseplate subunit TssE [Vibrio coralliilyticus]KPH26737.1 lysozyme [Vibrio coralliilyticus]
MGFWKTFIDPRSSMPSEEIDDIKYHLTKLLESESSLVDIDDRFTELQRSNLRFGIEDVQLLSASLDQTQLALRLESYIRNFEPRLTQVMVELLERKDNENALVFNIIAKAKTSKGEQELIFDSKISLNDLTTVMTEDSYD